MGIHAAKRLGLATAIMIVACVHGIAATTARATPECPADFNGDDVVNSNDISAFLTAWLARVNDGGCPAPPAACPEDVNSDDAVNSTDISSFLTLWLEAVNTGGCPSDVSVTMAPTTGGLGDIVTMTISPASAPRIFDSGTTAAWTGRYVPMIGSPTPPFTITFSSSDVREVSASQAHLVVGTGSGALPSGIFRLGPGHFQGTMTIYFSSGTPASGVAQFTPTIEAGRFESVRYPDGPGGLNPPEIDGPRPRVPVLSLSRLPNPLEPIEEVLFNTSYHHVAAVVRVAQSSAASKVAPASLAVDLVSYDAAGAELARVTGLLLPRVIDDGDPDFIVYHNDLTRPILLVDSAVNGANYPSVVMLRAEVGGRIVILPGAN